MSPGGLRTDRASTPWSIRDRRHLPDRSGGVREGDTRASSPESRGDVDESAHRDHGRRPSGPPVASHAPVHSIPKSEGEADHACHCMTG